MMKNPRQFVGALSYRLTVVVTLEPTRWRTCPNWLWTTPSSEGGKAQSKSKRRAATVTIFSMGYDFNVNSVVARAC
jgi:hypothetical protein